MPDASDAEHVSLVGESGAGSDAANSADTEANSELVEDVEELVIIDAGVPDLDALMEDFANRGDSVNVVVLQAGDDSIRQLGEIIQPHRGLKTLHLISHGSDGLLELGGEKITTLDLLARTGDIRDWRYAFTDDADILIYGCDVAASADGRNFVDTLARLTRTDVAASEDVTGAV
ncbi:MAG: DUF4347 domain-containing protein, partial [Granulosicoccus sp.]